MVGERPRSSIVLEAPAKVNLYLEVGPRDAEGYHRVKTLFQTLDLWDVVELEVGPGRGIEVLVEGDAPPGEDNLCHRAAAAFLRRAALERAVRVKLKKNIPPAAGLGGGSSDAAAVLRGLNRLLGDPLGGEDLFRLAASLGSDVSFFLVGGTALGEGRGEAVTPLRQAPPLPVVLANPGVPLSTADVYGCFDRVGGGMPPPGALEELIRFASKGAVEEMAARLFNSLERAAGRLCPSIGEIIRIITAAGAPGAAVSGSGPTVFALSRSEEEAMELERRLVKEVAWVKRTRFRSSGVAPAV